MTPDQIGYYQLCMAAAQAIAGFGVIIVAGVQILEMRKQRKNDERNFQLSIAPALYTKLEVVPMNSGTEMPSWSSVLEATRGQSDYCPLLHRLTICLVRPEAAYETTLAISSDHPEHSGCYVDVPIIRLFTLVAEETVEFYVTGSDQVHKPSHSAHIVVQAGYKNLYGKQFRLLSRYMWQRDERYPGAPLAGKWKKMEEASYVLTDDEQKKIEANSSHS